MPSGGGEGEEAGGQRGRAGARGWPRRGGGAASGGATMGAGGGGRDVGAVWAALKAREAPRGAGDAGAARARGGGDGDTGGQGGAGLAPAAAPEGAERSSPSVEGSSAGGPDIGCLEIGFENADDMEEKLRRDLNVLKAHESDLSARLSVLRRLEGVVRGTDNETLSAALVTFLGKALLKALDDPAGRCREAAAGVLLEALSEAPDSIQPLLPYAFPVLGERLGLVGGSETRPLVECAAFLLQHSHTQRVDIAELRGHAQAKGSAREPSEEVRLLCLRVLHAFVCGAGSGLGPYVPDCLEILLSATQDNYYEMMIEACAIQCTLANVLGHRLHQVSKVLVAAFAPLLCQRRNRVRVAALRAISAVMPFGAHETLLDLTSFVDPNLVSIKSFYQSDARINYMGVLAKDPSTAVRQEFLDTVGGWLTKLTERMDHEPRLLPYVLSGLADPVASVQESALEWVRILGEQHISDNEQEFKDKLRYMPREAQGHGWMLSSVLRAIEEGTLTLPPPFKERPPLGSRTLVQTRFVPMMHGIIRDFEQWQEAPKLKAAQLLQALLVYVEEFVTEHLHVLVPALAKAVVSTDGEVRSCVDNCCRLIGQYVETSVLLHVISPTAGLGPELPERKAFLKVLTGVLSGSTFSGSAGSHVNEILDLVSDDAILNSEAQDTRAVVTALMRELIESAKDTFQKDNVASTDAALVLLRLGKSRPTTSGEVGCGGDVQGVLELLGSGRGEAVAEMLRHFGPGLLSRILPEETMRPESDVLVFLNFIALVFKDGLGASFLGLLAAQVIGGLQKSFDIATDSSEGLMLRVVEGTLQVLKVAQSAGERTLDQSQTEKLFLSILIPQAKNANDLSEAALEAAALVFDYSARERFDVSRLVGLDELEPFFEVFSSSPICLRLKSLHLVESLAKCSTDGAVAVSEEVAVAAFNLQISRLADATCRVRCCALRAMAVCIQFWGSFLSEELLLKTGESVRLHTAPDDLEQEEYRGYISEVLQSLGGASAEVLARAFSGQLSSGIPGLAELVHEALGTTGDLAN